MVVVIGVTVHAELVLVVGAVERHLDLPRVGSVRMRVVHGAITALFAILPFGLVLGEVDLLLLGLGLGFSAQFGLEAGFIVLVKVFGIRVSDGDVVEKLGTPEHKFFFPCRRLSQQFLRVVSEDGHDQLVESFGFGGWTGVLAGAVALLGVKGGCVENHATFASARYCSDISVCADINTFGFEIGRPVGVKIMTIRKCDHGRKIRQECFRIIVPKLHVRVVE